MGIKKKASSRIEINRFLGVNESDGGQTILKRGESPYMRNFRIDDNGKLQKRFGWSRIFSASGNAIKAMWYGTLAGQKRFFFIMNKKLYELDMESGSYTEKVTFSGTGEYFCMFFFKDALYIMTDDKYHKYNGNTLSQVSGYIPYLKKNTRPDGSGSVCEQPNLLTNRRRQLFSPDGTTKAFHLAEKNIGSIQYVRQNGESMSGFTTDYAEGVITFSAAPERGYNTIEVEWTEKSSDYSKMQTIIGKMRYAAPDGGGDRLFLWGSPDCPNKIFWCGLTENGANAEYFCEGDCATVGNGQKEITDIVRQYDRNIIFTEDDAWYSSPHERTRADGTKYVDFPVYPLNGNKGLKIKKGGQLIDNNPFSVMPEGVYEWKPSSVQDERNAKLISQRVSKTISQYDVSTAATFDDEGKGEYWLAFPDGTCILYNYRMDVWYIYDGIPATEFIKVDDEIYFSTADGSICKFNDTYKDDGKVFECEWQMNFEGFGTEYMNKNLLRTYVGLEPESRASYKLLWQTDRDCSAFYSKEPIEGGYAFFGYDIIQYDDFSYDTLYTPKIFRHRMLLKRFSYVKLYIKNDAEFEGCTVVGLTLEGYPSGETKE